MERKYDYLIVGAGLFGSVFAHESASKGKKVLVLDRREHIGGNVYTQRVEGINVHVYGAHIFHTDNPNVWNYINKFARFNHYINSPIAISKGKVYNLPFNMNTFNRFWNVIAPKDALAEIERQRKAIEGNPKNLEEQAISLVGTDIYYALIKGYTEKQWGRSATELPTDIIKRIPLRFTYDNNYFNDRYQGIPIGGYTQIFEKLLNGCEVCLNTDFLSDRMYFKRIADKIIFSGAIDEYFDYQFGSLEYRSLHFETKVLDEENYQGNAVVNYTDIDVPYTRTIEHKHFEFGRQANTVLTYEYPVAWKQNKEAYYPINNEVNNALFERYCRLSENEKNVFFGGRLGQYKYFDMDKVIAEALSLSERLN